MKGTAPRRADPAADRAEAEALAADPKQRAENLMIVDLLRNDLARVAEAGSVAVPDLFAVESFPTRPPDGQPRHRAARARHRRGRRARNHCFRAGRSPAPPRSPPWRACATSSPNRAGPTPGRWGGSIPSGDAAFNVLIRTLEISQQSGEIAENPPLIRLGLGSGLVVDSIVEDEWSECLLKGKFVASNSSEFDLIETMRFDPQDGNRRSRPPPRPARRLGHNVRFSVRPPLRRATNCRPRPSVAAEPAMLRLLLSPNGDDGDRIEDLCPSARISRWRSRSVRCRSPPTTSASATRPPTRAFWTKRGRRAGRMKRSSSIRTVI